jgi:hypothetical protein
MRGRYQGTRIELHLQVLSRTGVGSAGVLTVAGDVSCPGLPPRTLVEEGTATLKPVSGLSVRLRWRASLGRHSLLATALGDGTLGVTVHDQEGKPVGAGTLPFAWPQALRALPTVHATDVTSSVVAARQRGSLVAGLWRAARARPSVPSRPGRREEALT